MKDVDKQEKKPNEGTSDLLKLATSVALGLMKGEQLNGLIEMTKIQLQVYKNFLGFGCSEKEAQDQTLIYMTAMAKAVFDTNKGE